MGPPQRALCVSLAIVAVVWAGVFAIRLAAPSDLADNDQPRPVAYALDIIANGSWVLQRDAGGTVTTKPPLHAWLIALASLPTGEVSRLTVALPSALSMLGVACGVTLLTLRIASPTTATLAGLAALLSPMGVKMTLLARTDPLLTFTVFLAFAIGVLGGQQRSVRARVRWRIAFWIAASVAVFTKGPVALLFVIPALLFRAPLEDRAPGARRTLLWTHALAALAVPLLIGGWLAAAVATGGREVWDVMIGYEVVAQTLHSNEIAGRTLVESLRVRFAPIAYAITWFLPWSVLAAVRIGRVLARRTPPSPMAALEKALAWQVVFMLAIFVLASHKRSDHLAPLIPAMAILAAMEVAPLLDRLGAWSRIALAALVPLALAGVWVEHFGRRDDHMVRLTGALLEMGSALRHRGIEGREIAFVHIDIVAQMPIGAKEPIVAPEELPEALASGRRYIVTHDPAGAAAAVPGAAELEAAGDEDVRIYLFDAAPGS